MNCVPDLRPCWVKRIWQNEQPKHYESATPRPSIGISEKTEGNQKAAWVRLNPLSNWPKPAPINTYPMSGNEFHSPESITPPGALSYVRRGASSNPIIAACLFYQIHCALSTPCGLLFLFSQYVVVLRSRSSYLRHPSSPGSTRSATLSILLLSPSSHIANLHRVSQIIPAPNISHQHLVSRPANSR